MLRKKKFKNFPNTYTLQPVKTYYMKYPILHGASLSSTLAKKTKVLAWNKDTQSSSKTQFLLDGKGALQSSFAQCK